MGSALALVSAVAMAALVFMAILFLRGRTASVDLNARLDALREGYERLDGLIREELAVGRRDMAGELSRLREEVMRGQGEHALRISASIELFRDALNAGLASAADRAAANAHDLREELTGSVRGLGSLQAQHLAALERRLADTTQGIDLRLEAVARTLDARASALEEQVSGGLATARGESKETRREIQELLRTGLDALSQTEKEHRQSLANDLARLGEASQHRSEALQAALEERLRVGHEDVNARLDKARGEAAITAHDAHTLLEAKLDLLARGQREAWDSFLTQLLAMTESSERKLELARKALDERLATIHGESVAALEKASLEASASAKESRELVDRRLETVSRVQQEKWDEFSRHVLRLTESIEAKLEAMRNTVNQRLFVIQEDNGKRLEAMRQTVNEKLHATLEARFAESFGVVRDQLEQVYRGLGEMKSLATGVGDLKRVLTNVKARGVWGEMQLGCLLEQMLSPDQYEANVATTGIGQRVEYAIKLPGREDGGGTVWLPIDAKFPVEDYQRLVEASERGDSDAIEAAASALETRVRACAKDLAEKYLAPPGTTDFGILFLATEGLYAETLRRPGLAERIQREHRVIIAGPTTLAAILSSLQMGFRTLAIQKRSSDVWKVLGAVKTEFGKFGTLLDKLHKKLNEATNMVENGTVRTRAIQRQLRTVEELPVGEAQALLGSAGDDVFVEMPEA